MKQIICYLPNGKQYHIRDLNTTNLQRCHGHLIKCYLKDKSVEVGYADGCKAGEGPNESDVHPHDYIYLWTWKNLDEETHKFVGSTREERLERNYKRVEMIDIEKIELILYSQSGMQDQITNKFFIEDKIQRDDKKYNL